MVAGHWRFDTFHFHARDALAIHFGDGETQIFVDKTLAAAGNESELVEDEAADCGVGRIFRDLDRVLRFEIADVQRRIENDRAIG